MEGSEASAGRPECGKQVEHIEVPQPVHGTRSDSLGDPPGTAKLSAEEPDALMHARPGPWEPWRVTARATQPYAPKPTSQARFGPKHRMQFGSRCCALRPHRPAHRTAVCEHFRQV